MTAWRVASFYQKEPDTIAWLRRLPHGSVFLDIGANVGMYSLAAALARGCQVYAFEPESQNYALLNANIALNNASGRVVAFCAALTDKPGFDRLYLSRFDPQGGGSCHSYGAEVGFDLTPRQAPFSQGCIGVTLDELVSSGALPVPNYIKIDVDGFEHKVIKGALQTLNDHRVQELLIEINPALPEHQSLLQQLRALGFYFDPDQQRHAARKTGSFQGVGEIIFRRLPRHNTRVSLDTMPYIGIARNNAPRPDAKVLEYILGRIAATPITEHPFPYMVVDKIFPEPYFQMALEHFPTDEQMVPIDETGRAGPAYRDRLVTLFTLEHFERLEHAARDFWLGFADWLYSEQFINGVIDKFWPHVACRLADLAAHNQGIKVHGDALIVSDKTNYAIGPHTDVTRRLITFLFYLPKDESLASLGTSIYTPKDPYLESDGSKHFPFEPFVKLTTIPFLPNRALIFVRNNRSFHGVEPITLADPERHLVIYNIRIAEPSPAQPAKPPVQ
jgi:FkbM family methyltransferase